MSTGHQIAMALRNAYWAMHRQADACFQPLGVTANQFVLLSLLAESDGGTQRELVERASSDPNTVRAMLVALEEKGLIERRRHLTDRRAWCVFLTSAGQRKFKKLQAQSESFRQRLIALFDTDEPDVLLELLHRVTAEMSPEIKQHLTAIAS